MIITRFAPSPTGTLHIGSVRTVLFNWLYAKANNGKFLLRIEDTDQERSKPEHVKNIIDTLKNLGIDYDEEIVFQSQRINRHKEIALKLLEESKAYKCYCTQEELENQRKIAIQNKETPKYNRKCRDLKEELNKPYTIRLKVELSGDLNFFDEIQGNCCVKNEYLDDMILLRSDGTPTYMLAVVVDDFDMKITHVIRGTEHLNNAYRQLQIYNACKFIPPSFAHVSLIHTENGEKLSKRNGAKSVQEYQEEGFLKEAILNYLLRLGWSYGDNEIISMQQACEIFEIKNVRSSCARFSLDKLYSMNSIYLKEKSNEELIEMLKNFDKEDRYKKEGWARVLKGMPELKKRSRTLKELLLMADIYGYEEEYFGNITPSNEISELIKYTKENTWTNPEQWLKDFLKNQNLNLKEIAPIIRFAITKSNVSPGLFEIMNIIGQNLFLNKLINANKLKNFSLDIKLSV